MVTPTVGRQEKTFDYGDLLFCSCFSRVGIQRLFANIGQHIFCHFFEHSVLDFELATLLLGVQEVSLHVLTALKSGNHDAEVGSDLIFYNQLFADEGTRD